MTAVEPSPFALAQPELARMGYSAVIPLIPPSAMHHAGRGKAPGAFVSGTWRGLTGWQRFRESTPSTFEIGMWSRMPDANVGLLLGTPAGAGHQVIAIDIDVTDADELALLQSVLPTSPMSKRAAKGVTLMYRAPVALKSRSYDRAATETTRAERLVDLLARGRQTCLPPSRHPAGVTYQWVTGPAAPNDLPVLTDDDLEKLEDTLETMGWVRDGRTTGQSDQPSPRAALGAFDPSDPWSVAKAQALARLDEWFPDLDLPGTRRARGGWEALAVWRASSTGRPVEMRKRNLSASSTGIRDWGASGADAGLTAIDVVQRALDLTASEALIWLQDKLGIEDDDGDVIIDLAPTTAAQTKAPPAASGGDETEGAVVLGGAVTVTEAAPSATHGAPSEMPVHLLEVPGLVGDLMGWMARTAQRPLPIINLGAALCIVGTLAARKWATPTEGGTHLYILGLAGTGQGKDHPRRAATHILAAAGLKRFVAPSSWKSDSALVQHVSRNPACVSFSDEVGEFIGRLNSKGASTHERGVSGVMRELWGVNWGIHTPPGWADSRDRQRVEPISAPAYSFLGLSVPEAVWEALAGSDLSNGFANRFIVLASDRDVPEQDPDESVFDVPEALLERLRDLANYGGHLANITMHHGETSAPMVRVPWEGGRGGPAHQVFKAFQEFCRLQPESETLMKRTAEIACRLATIRAIGIAGPDAVVTVADIEWAREVAVWSARRMIADTAAYMSESDHQARAKFVLRHLNEAPDRYLSRTALCRKVNHRFDGRVLDLVLEGLLDAGQVRLNESDRKGPGRKATGYFAA